MQLILFHGRRDPNEEMTNWGFNGPTLKNVVAVHFTYMSTIAVYFGDSEDALIAREQTGWDQWDEYALEMKFEDDMVRCVDEEGFAYYGDWEVQARSGMGMGLELEL